MIKYNERKTKYLQTKYVVLATFYANITPFSHVIWFVDTLINTITAFKDKR